MTHVPLHDELASKLTLASPRNIRELAWRPAGRMQAVYTRTCKEPDPLRVKAVQTMAGHGIVDDRHARAWSPRQLLIAGDPAYENFDLPDAALRENFRVSGSTELLQSGDLLRIGADVVVWLTFHCEPCGLLEKRCPGTIKTIGRHRGMLARVLRGGTVAADDEIWIARSSLPAMSTDWRLRVQEVLKAVPDGQCITYSQLAEMAGVANAYCRAFPRILSGLREDVSQRVCRGGGQLPRPQWRGVELYDVGDHLSWDL